MNKVDPAKLLIPGLGLLLVVGAFFIGSLWTKVQYLEKSGVGTGSSVAGTQGAGAGQPAPDPYTAVKAKDLNIPEVKSDEHIKGEKNAKLSWIEYSDLECPFCQRIHPDLQKILSEYDGKVKWVYRHFPLDQIHSKADKEAEAVECAGELGGNDAFWVLVDKIFEVTPANNGLDLDKLPDYAAEVGLDKSAFKSCLDSGKYAGKVEEQYQGGVRAGVNGTPGNFLLDDNGNAYVIPGAVPYATIKQIIDKALATR